MAIGAATFPEANVTVDAAGVASSVVGVTAWVVGAAGGGTIGVVAAAGVVGAVADTEVTAAGVDEPAPDSAPVTVAPVSKVVVPTSP